MATANIRINRPHRFRLKLPYRLRPLHNNSVICAVEHEGEVVTKEVRMTPAGMTEKEFLHAINYYDWEQLVMFHGIGDIVAHNIIKVRNTDGLFFNLDELMRVPLVGQHRFKQLVGRPSQFKDHRLKLLVQHPTDQALSVRDLQPVKNPPEQFERVCFGPEEILNAEKRKAKESGNKLVVRKILDWRIYFHVKPGKLEGRSRLFFKKFPTALRYELLQRGFHQTKESNFTRPPFYAS